MNGLGWKYGMILIGWEGPGGSILREPAEEGDEPLCQLVELYPNNDGLYNSYCPADLRTPEALKWAMQDVERDGINEWFFDNGSFSWEPQRDITEHGYQFYWTPNDAEEYRKNSLFGDVDDFESVEPGFLNELEAKYPGKTVAFIGREVVGVYDDLLSMFEAGIPEGAMTVSLSLSPRETREIEEKIAQADRDTCLPMSTVARRVHAWRLNLFGEQSRMRNLAQIVEEVGEVARACGKEEEGIREHDRGNLADELGDVILATLGMSRAEGIDIESVVKRRLLRMESIDYGKKS